MTTFILNRELVRTGEPEGTPLLDFVRDAQGLTGTKEACREGECGACTVLLGEPRPGGGVDYRAVASCLVPLGEAHGRHVITVEGLEGDGLTLVQRLIVEASASQCGFCTPGIVLSLTGFCFAAETFTAEEAADALDGNICRCTGYVAIREAARVLCERLGALDRDPAVRLEALIGAGVLPAYLREIPGRLAAIPDAPEPPGDATPVGGATDLLVQRPEALREAPLHFLSRRADLRHVREEGGALRVGGAVTLEAFRRSGPVRRLHPALEADLLLHSSAILRHRATLAGNVVNASPIGDATIMLLALDATLVLEARDGTTRETPLSRFFKGYKTTDLARGEIVREIVIPPLPAGGRYRFEKVSNREHLDIAAVNSALRVATAPGGTIRELRLAAGGVAPVPLLLPGLETFAGRPLDAGTGEEVARAAEAAATPIDDIRGSATYKRRLLGQQVRAHFRALAAKGAEA